MPERPTMFDTDDGLLRLFCHPPVWSDAGAQARVELVPLWTKGTLEDRIDVVLSSGARQAVAREYDDDNSISGDLQLIARAGAVHVMVELRYGQGEAMHAFEGVVAQFLRP